MKTGKRESQERTQLNASILKMEYGAFENYTQTKKGSKIVLYLPLSAKKNKAIGSFCLQNSPQDCQSSLSRLYNSPTSISSQILFPGVQSLIKFLFDNLPFTI